MSDEVPAFRRQKHVDLLSSKQSGLHEFHSETLSQKTKQTKKNQNQLKQTKKKSKTRQFCHQRESMTGSSLRALKASGYSSECWASIFYHWLTFLSKAISNLPKELYFPKDSCRLTTEGAHYDSSLLLWILCRQSWPLTLRIRPQYPGESTSLFPRLQMSQAHRAAHIH